MLIYRHLSSKLTFIAVHFLRGGTDGPVACRGWGGEGAGPNVTEFKCEALFTMTTRSLTSPSQEIKHFMCQLPQSRLLHYPQFNTDARVDDVIA